MASKLHNSMERVENAKQRRAAALTLKPSLGLGLSVLPSSPIAIAPDII